MIERHAYIYTEVLIKEEQRVEIRRKCKWKVGRN